MPPFLTIWRKVISVLIIVCKLREPHESAIPSRTSYAQILSIYLWNWSNRYDSLYVYVWVKDAHLCISHICVRKPHLSLTCLTIWSLPWIELPGAIPFALDNLHHAAKTSEWSSYCVLIWSASKPHLIILSASARIRLAYRILHSPKEF